MARAIPYPYQADLEIDTTQQNRTEIGRQAAAGEIGADCVGWNGGKTQLFWSRIHVGQGVFVSMNVD